jgi:hypothetical protein
LNIGFTPVDSAPASRAPRYLLRFLHAAFSSEPFCWPTSPRGMRAGLSSRRQRGESSPAASKNRDEPAAVDGRVLAFDAFSGLAGPVIVPAE